MKSENKFKRKTLLRIKRDLKNYYGYRFPKKFQDSVNHLNLTVTKLERELTN